MRNFFFVIFCAAVVFLQVSSAGVIFGSERVPNFALALVISLVLVLGFEKSLAWIILTGILVDVYSGWIIGMDALVMIIIAWVVSALLSVADIKSRKSLFFPALFLLSAGFALIYDILAGIFMHVAILWLNIGGSYFRVNYSGWDYTFKIFFTALSVYAVYYFVERINRLFSRPAPAFVRK
ncbi:MAG: hypothetical protein WC831_02175 [Parcubacteria group bacterium]|jgi:cell shape-determining protein MreD